MEPAGKCSERGLNRVAVNGVEVPIVGGSDAAWTWGYPFPPSKWDPTNYRLWGHGSGSPDARVMYSGIASGTALITPTQAAALLSAALGVPPDPGTVGSVSFHSDLSWSAFSASPFPPSSATSVGMALGVCHSPAVPCSTGDLEVGNNAGQWPVDTSSIPFAKWIWLPGITGQTPAANVNAWFEKVINVPGTPTGGSVQVAVDDGAEIYVNGTSIGRAGILDGDPIGFDSLVTRSIPPGILVEGNNVITVRGLNGTTPGDYNTNPAAVIFSGTINFVYGSTTTTTTTVAANTTTTVPVVPVGAFTASIVRGPNSAAGSAVYTVTLRATGVVTGGVYEFVVPSGHVPEPVPPDRITHRFPKSAVNGEVVWEYSLLAPRGVFRAEVYSVGGTTPFSSVEVK